MRDAMERFAASLAAAGSADADSFRPDLSRDEIATTASGLGLTFPEDIYVLYGYCDGMSPPKSAAAAVDGYRLLPLADAAALHRTRGGGALLPLFRRGERYYHVQCGLGDDRFGEVIHDIPEEEPWPAFASVKTMFETICDWYAVGLEIAPEAGTTNTVCGPISP